MLVDYSSAMAEEQIDIALEICKKTFHLLEENDTVGLILYNEIVHQSFPIQEKKRLAKLIEQQIKRSSTFDIVG